MDISGEEKVRPKYDLMFLLDEDVFAANNKVGEPFSLYNLEGEKIGKDEYLEMSHFYDGEHCFARVGKHDVVLINKKGEEQKLKTSIYAIGMTEDNKTLESDYYDMDEVVSAMQITPSGFLGLDTKTTGPDAIGKLNSSKGVWSSISTEARKYSNNANITTDYHLTNKSKAEIEVNTYGLIKQERTGSGWFSYTRDVWTEEYVKSYRLSLYANNNYQLEGKMREMYAKMLETVKKIGKTVKEGKNAALIEAGAGLYYFIAWGGKRIDLFYGYYNPETFDVNAFDNASEEEYIEMAFPRLSVENEATQEPVDDDYGDLGSPPADDLL